MKLFLLKLFTWWNGQTFGTQLWTWRFGELVGTDEQGNHYFRTKGRKIDPTLGFERRWVIYHGMRRRPPCRRPGMVGCITPSMWRRPKRLTPRAMAEAASARPDRYTGRLSAHRFDACARPSPKATGDYQAWTPGG